MKCRKAVHEIDAADTWRASNGARCRECYRVTQRRYDESLKGYRRHLRYEETAKAIRRRINYDRTRWDGCIRLRDDPRSDRSRIREHD
jgi:hypothetical protein